MRRKNPTYLALLTLLSVIAFSSCQQEPSLLPQPDTASSNRYDGAVNPTAQGTSVPLGGNAFITKKANGGSEAITSSGLINWTNPNAVVSTFFKIKNTGQLIIAFRAAVPVGSSTLKVTANGQEFTVDAVSGDSYKRYIAGVINVTTPGYIKVDLQGISNSSGSVFANVSDLIIYGDAATGAIFANDVVTYNNSRAGAELSLQYKMPNDHAQWFYNEITVPTGADKAGTTYASNGFTGGFAGLQLTAAEEKRIVFSVANPTSGAAAVLRKNTGALVDAAAVNGKSVYLPFKWNAGTTYKFITQAKADANGITTLSAWVYTPEDDQWKYIASCSRGVSGNYLTGLYSALSGTNPDNGYQTRRVRFGNQWVNTGGVWSEITEAVFNGNSTAALNQRNDYAASVEYASFSLKSQGFFNDNVTLNTTLSRMSAATAPALDLSSLP